MFYRQHMDHEDSDVITIDSGSINSEASSPVLSPVVDENTVIDILDGGKSDSVEDTQRSKTRGKFRELFRSLSWRNKPKQKKENKSNALELNEEEAHIEIDNEQFSFSDSPIRNNYSFDNLYDTSKPLLYLQPNASDDNAESFTIDQENAFLPQCKASPNSSTTAESAFTSVNIDDSVKVRKVKSPKRSLSRKFSIFSIRSRPATAPNTFDLSDASSYFMDETLLSNWRMPKHRPPSILPKRCPDHFEAKKNTKLEGEIYLFLDNFDSKTEKSNKQSFKEKMQTNNIEKMLYFPYSKLLFESSCLNKGNFLSVRDEKLNLTVNSEPHFFIYNDNQDATDIIADSDNDGPKKTCALSVKSLRFQELIEDSKAETDLSNEHISWNNSVNSLFEVDQYMGDFDFKGLLQIQAKSYDIEPSKVWKLWIDVVDKSKKSHRKFSVFTVISEYSQIKNLQTNYDTLLDYYIQDKNQQLYLLRDGELPVFHGKHKVKTYGEYVFIIPLINIRQVWRVMLHLLVTEQLSLNSSKYEVIGICWRRYTYKKQFGYHLTLYVDDRARFSFNRASLFLSDVRLMVPEGVKHCFKRCKTVFPGEKEVRIIDVL